MGTDEHISPMRLLEICEVCLLYIGTHMYSELKLRPFVTVHVPALTEAPGGVIPAVTENCPNTEKLWI